MAKPVCQLPTRLFPPTPLRLRPDGAYPSSGQFLQSGHRRLWCLRENTVFTMDATTGERLSAWTAKGAEVTQVCELQLSATRSYLLVGVSVEGRSVVGVVNASVPRLVRAVEVPHRVTALHAVSPSNLSTPGLFSQSALRQFSGIAAVGCRGGHVYLVDLGLGGREMTEASLRQPSGLRLLSPTQGPVGAELSQAIESGNHVGLELSAMLYHGRNFLHPTKPSEPPRPFAQETVSVTAIYYAPQLSSLFVGYSFGSFHIYSLSELTLVFASPSPSPLLPPPVTHFTYQEAENDPKSYVYLWVGRGRSPSADVAQCQTKISLYCLLYESKISTPEHHSVLYQNFQSCNCRFAFALTPNPSQPNPRTSQDSRLLHCFTLSHTRRKDHDEPRESRSWDLSLSVFVWSADQQVFVGVFDINQWYHSQMPTSVHWKLSGQYTGILGCPYFAFFSLTPALESGCGPLLDAMVTKHYPLKVLPPVPETHLWPTSLSIDVCLLTPSSVIRCEYYGLQRTAVWELGQAGVVGFTQPQRLFSLCEQAELVSPQWEGGVADHTDLNFQRKVLFFVAVDHGLVATAKQCVEVWRGGGGACSPQLIANWIGERMREVTEEKNALCRALFNEHAHPMDAWTLDKLAHLVAVLKRWSKVIHCLLQPSSQSEELLLDDTTKDLLGHYHTAVVQCRLVEVIAWCARMRLLPLTNDESDGDFFHYPGHALEQLYDHLRSRQEPNKMVVDHLLEELQEEDGSEEEFAYPPPSLDELMIIFTSSNSLAHHVLMLYFLCDVEETATEERYTKLISTYCSVLPHALSDLAKGLWCLDHHKFQESMSLLCSPSVSVYDWFPWLRTVVVNTLLASGEAERAMIYLETNRHGRTGSLEDAKLEISVHVAAGCLDPALETVRTFQNLQSSHINEMYCHLLDCCYHAKQLRKFTALKLDEYEEEFLAGYLEDHPDLKAQELLVYFLLQRSRFVEAQHIQEKIRPIAKVSSDPSVRERLASRDTLLAGFSRCVPEVVKKLHTKQKPWTPKTKVERSEPVALSKALAQDANLHPVSQAGQIRTIMETTAAYRAAPMEPVSPFGKSLTELKHTPFLSTPPTVRKGRMDIHQTPLVVPTTVPVQTSPTLPLTPNPEMAEFRNLMMSFQSRIAQLRQSDGTSTILDSPILRTPFSKTPASRSVSARPLVVTPPSILKTKPVTDVLQGREGEMDESTANTATKLRKIRFAVEGTPLVSPGSSPVVERRRLPTPHVPTMASSPFLTPSHMALTTPLPVSDDSDAFVSPVESPSQLSRIEPSPSPTQPPPKMKLFAGVTEGGERGEDVGGERGEDVGGERGEEVGERDEEEMGVCVEDEQVEGEAEENKMEERSGEEVKREEEEFASAEGQGVVKEEEEEEDKIEPKLAVPHTSMNASIKLVRVSLGSVVMGRAPPSTSLPTSANSPFKPSPLTTHVRSASVAEGHSSPYSAGKKGLLTPVLTTELVETRRQNLQSSLEAIRKKHVAEFRAVSSPRVSVSFVKDQPSATMVRQPSKQDVPGNVVPPSQRTPQTAYGFSPPAKPSPSASLLRKTLDLQPVLATPISYAFSPPLTRSEARRRAQAAADWPDKDELSAAQDQPVLKQKPRHTHGHLTSSSQDPVLLLTPPTPYPHQQGEKDEEKGRQGRGRRQKPVRTVIARRSKRLLMQDKL